MIRRNVEHVVKLDHWSKILLGLIAVGLLMNVALQFHLNSAIAQAPASVNVTGSLEISPPRNGSFRVQCIGCR
jgi:hypothetical protein